MEDIFLAHHKIGSVSYGISKMDLPLALFASVRLCTSRSYIPSTSEQVKYPNSIAQADSPSLLFVASLFEEQPFLVDISEERPTRRVLPSLPLRFQADPENPDAKPSAKDGKHATCVTIFTDLGNHIIAGTSKGWINIIETQTCKTIHSTKLCNGMNILLRLGSNGRDLVVNSSDSVIRTIILPDLRDLGVSLQPSSIKLEIEHKFQDLVNKLAWNHVAFSSTGEYVTASTYMNSDIYIWERVQGSLVRILEGPKEEMGVVEWHPSRPMVAACGLETGRVWLWSITTPQKWSALAPDFQEVEENVLYQEREDEFDMAPPEATHQRRMDQEDEDVDVLTIEPVKGETADFDRDFRMPTILDIEDSESEEDIVAVGPGQLRRRSPGREDAGLDSGMEDAKRSTPASKSTSRRKR